MKYLLSIWLLILVTACSESPPQETSPSESSESQTTQITSSEPDDTSEEETIDVAFTTVDSETDFKTEGEDIQVVVHESGEGRRIHSTDFVNFKITLSSYADGKRGNVIQLSPQMPKVFPIGCIISHNHVAMKRLPVGIAKALIGQRNGSSITALVPPADAFGPRGVPGVVDPESWIVMDITVDNVTRIPDMPTFDSEDLRWQSLENRIKVIVLEEGQGAKYESGQKCEIHFTGYTSKGVIIHTSIGYPEPVRLMIENQRNLIPGWIPVIKNMKVGDKVLAKIPPSSAFGEQGIKDLVSPNETVYYVFELLDLFSKPTFPEIKQDDSRWKDIGDGIKVIVYEEGKGELLSEKAIAYVDYTLWLSDGKEIDSSFHQPQPLRVDIAKPPSQGGVIEGWRKTLQTMKVGTKLLVRIPPEQGYGDRDSPVIPANSELIFMMEVLGAQEP